MRAGEWSMEQTLRSQFNSAPASPQVCDEEARSGIQRVRQLRWLLREGRRSAGQAPGKYSDTPIYSHWLLSTRVCRGSARPGNPRRWFEQGRCPVWCSRANSSRLATPLHRSHRRRLRVLHSLRIHHRDCPQGVCPGGDTPDWRRGPGRSSRKSPCSRSRPGRNRHMFQYRCRGRRSHNGNLSRSRCH